MKREIKESAAREVRVWGWAVVGLIIWMILGAIL